MNETNESLKQQIADLIDGSYAYIGVKPTDTAQQILDLINEPTEAEKCQICDAKVKKYKSSMNIVITQALIKISRAVYIKAQNKPFTEANDIYISRLPKEIEMTHEERSNISKLRVHGLIAKVKENDEVKRGRWLITRQGWAYLRGEEITNTVTHFRNRVIDRSDDKTTIGEVMTGAEYSNTLETLRQELAKLPEDLQ